MTNADGDLPDWIRQDLALARAGAAALLGRDVRVPATALSQSTAFGLALFDGARLYFDACISTDSLDYEFLDRILGGDGPDDEAVGGRVAVLTSQPDDKDVAGIRAAFVQRPRVIYHEVSLSGTRGYLNYAQVTAGGYHLAELPFDDLGAATALLQQVRAKADVIYCVGTQTFVRLIKRAANGQFNAD
jgi:hypothetical protein